jgi:hypothetical protein
MEFTITETNENLAYWRQRDYLNEATRQLLTNVDVMIVPEEDFRDYEIPLFPSNMMELYDLLKEHLNVEAAINDEDYSEVSLNSRVHRYGKFVVLSAVVPIFIGLLTNYIYDKLKHEDPKDEINLEIVVQDKSGKAQSVKYQGTAQNFNKVADKVKELAKTESHEHRADTAQSATQGPKK